MAVIDGGFQNLVQGVSQQERPDRRDGQCTLQQNMTSDVVKSLSRRTPTDDIASLFAKGVGANKIELLTNHDFATDVTGWTASTDSGDAVTFEAPSNAKLVATDGDVSIQQSFAGFVIGKSYEVRTIMVSVGANVQAANLSVHTSNIDGVSNPSDAHQVKSGLSTTPVELSEVFVATATTLFVGVELTDPTDDIAVLITQISIEQVVALEWDFHEFATNDTTYIVATSVKKIKVFNLAGVEQTVNATGNFYLGYNNASTVNDDVMYLTNKDIKTAMLPDEVGATPFAIAQVLGGQYGREFNVKLDDPANPGTWIESKYNTPDGGSSTHILNIASDFIAGEIYTAMVNNATFNTSFIVTRVHDVLLIGHKSAATTTRIEITSSDGEAGTLLITASDRTNITGNLPKWAPSNHVIEVTGLATSDEDATYYRFDQNKPGFGNDGLWVESSATDIPYKWNLETMPHTLLREDDGTFTFAEGAWEDRVVGDLITNPDRSFLGKAISDLSEFQGRLVLLSRGSVNMSRTNKPLDMWKSTAVVETDSDPIDVASTSDGGKALRYIAVHNRDLVVFADKAQFIIFGRNAITPKNTSMVFTTGFEIEKGARPSVAGKNIFFPFNSGSFSGIKEFFTEGSADINDSRPITAHVPKYIKGKAVRLTSSSNFDNLIVHSDDDKKVLYSYEYLWSEQDKVQSSWSTWTYTKDVVYTLFIESNLYMVIDDDGTYRLVVGDMDIRPDTGLTYTVFLDRKTVQTNAAEDVTYDTIYSSSEIDDVVAVQGAGCPFPGLQAEVISTNGSEITLEELEGGTVIFGMNFVSRYQPTMPMRKDRKGIKIGTGEMIVDYFLASYANTGEFHTKVTSVYYDDVIDSFEGYIADTPGAILGKQSITSGIHYVDFADDVDLAELEFYTKNYLPFTLLDLEYVGQWEKEGRRVS